MGIGAQASPLAGEQKLQEAFPLQPFGMRLTPRCQGSRGTQGKAGWPVRPGALVMGGLESRIENVRLQPVGLLSAERSKGIAICRCSTGQEVLVPAPEEVELPAPHRSEGDMVRGKGRASQVTGIQPAVLGQQIRADQERIAGEGRQALVGGVAIACRPQWEHLPKALAGGIEEVHEPIGARPEVADTIGPGQGGRVKDDTAGSMHG